MTSGFATVKGVTSGDTLLLVGRAAAGPPPELQLTLSGVAAPRLAKGSNAVDEPFAWAARDFLRRLALGKAVSFRVDGEAAGRSFGAAWLKTGAGEPESLALLLARAGWCRAQAPAKGGGGDDEALRAAEADARAAGLGAHARAAAGATRRVQWTGCDAAALAGTSRRALVEHVRDGSYLRCLVYGGPEDAPHADMAVVGVRLAGVRCGRVPFAPAGGDAPAGAPSPPPPPAEPFALQAKHFVEARLLHREVVVRFAAAADGAAGGAPVGDVAHAASGQRVGVALLREGLAKLDERALAALGDAALAATLRAAEAEARRDKRRLWRAYEKPSLGGGGADDFEGHVVEVTSGDTLVVGDAAGVERRVSLSSCRAPRPGHDKSGRAGEPWAAESREALRHAAVGRRVRVVVEQVRDVPVAGGGDGGADAPTRRLVLASVRLLPDARPGREPRAVPEDKQRDVAEALADLGLVRVVPPRSSEDRAARYDALAAAEQRAREKKLRLHSGRAPPPGPRVADLVGDARRARTFLPALQRAATVRATVEAVFSGSRVKLRAPAEGCAFVFGLACVRAPAAAARGRSGDACGDEARAFARRHLLQRVVDARVLDMDRHGVALGTLRLLPEDAKRSRHAPAPPGAPAVAAADDAFESRLLARGLGRLDARRADAGAAKAWGALEAAAQAARLGLWAHEATAEAAAAAAAPAARAAAPWRGRAAEVVDGATLYVHADPPAKLDAVLAAMRAFAPPATAAAAAHRRNAVVAAQFDDGSGLGWYRARVVEVGPGGATYALRYLDFGNLEAGVPAARVAPLDAARAALPPAAVECRLAHVRAAAVDDEAGEACARALHELVWGKGLELAEVPGRADGPRFRVRVVDGVAEAKAGGDSRPTVNEQLVERGLARVPGASKHAADDLAVAMRALQLGARAARAGVWRYGDCDFSDDEK